MGHLLLPQYGSQDPHGNWNGLIKEVLDGPEEGGAHFAIADLSITTKRTVVVSFSTPFLDVGEQGCQGCRGKIVGRMQGCNFGALFFWGGGREYTTDVTDKSDLLLPQSARRVATLPVASTVAAMVFFCQESPSCS